MEPEELIQNKEWWQLSADERAFLKPLAASESEYQVLKKMLQVTREDLDQVPPLDERLYKTISAELRPAPVRHLKWLGYAAAAAAVLIFALTLVFNKTTTKESPLVKKELAAPKAPATEQPLTTPPGKEMTTAKKASSPAPYYG